MTSGGMEAKTKGKEWRVKMLNGVGSITFPGCLCGVILIFGEKSHPIVVNKRGQVLCAAGK